MFDTKKVAAKIRELRIGGNMTQMELADSMGISVQAVSNWERGNSMPDISKLGELASLFHCSIDELLGESRNTQVLARILEEKDEELAAADIELEDMKEVAPLLKPNQMEHMLDACVKKQATISLEDIIPLAPFLSEKYLEELIEMTDDEGDFDSLIGLIPFLSGENVEKMAWKLFDQEAPNMDQVIAMAPFLSKKFLDQVVAGIDLEANFEDVMGLMPFISGSTMEKLARKALQKGEPGMDELLGMAPFLSRKFLGSLVNDILESGGEIDESEIAGLAPFLDKETLRKAADRMMKRGCFEGLASIAPFLK